MFMDKFTCCNIFLCIFAYQIVGGQSIESLGIDQSFHASNNNSLSSIYVELGNRFLNNRSKYRVIFVRHGESEWNKLKLYTGWYDAKLTEKGLAECKRCGEMVKKANLTFDFAFTSHLSRAQVTLDQILRESNQEDTVLVHKTWRLNERHYGALTGLVKNDSLFPHTYNAIPEPMDPSHPYWTSIAENPNYAHLVATNALPRTESVKLTLERALPYWNEKLLPLIKTGKRVLITSHANTLRGFFKMFDQLSDNETVDLEIRNGVPIIYEFDENFNVVVSRKYMY